MFTIHRRDVLGIILVVLAFAASERQTTAQLLLSDNFDTGNTNGGVPINWTIAAPAGTQISIVNSTVTAPASAPFCVQFIDNSTNGRPQMTQTFPPQNSGIASASLKTILPTNSPCSLQLLTANGKFLCALVLDSTGLIGYDNTSTGTVDSTIGWSTGVWRNLSVEWFGDGTFNAYVGTTQFVQRASFATNALPAQMLLATGYGGGIYRTGYVDNVQAVITEASLSDDFDTNNTFGSVPTGWVAAIPANTNIRIVNSSVRTPLSASNCVEFSNNSTSTSPQMDTNFPALPQGRYFFSTLLSSTNQGPFDTQLRTTNGTFLTAIRLGADGKVAYNATAGGSGPFTESAVIWATNTWQTLRVDWLSNNTFSAYLGSNQIIANLAFGTNLAPGEVLFRLTNTTSTNRLAYLDNVLVEESVFPKPAKYTNNGVWFGNAFMTTPSYVTNLPQVAFQMRNNYQIPNIFVNVGGLNSSGQITNPPPLAVTFMNTLKTWETQNGYTFKVFAWINGDTSVVDVNNETTQTNIIGEAEKFVSTTITNSYVAGATRAFDGVQIDLEPAGPNGSDTQFNNLKQMMIDMKSGFTTLGLGSKLTSVTAPPYSTATNSVWTWTPVYYYYMGVNCDLLCGMTYDTGITNGPAYESWLQDQTTNILQAVSGKYWNNDVNHPVPSNDIKVLIGFPAYPSTSIHTNTAENIFYAAPGVSAGLAGLVAHGDLSTNFFQGASIFLFTDGTGSDGYAGYDTDLWWFGQDWLDEW